jgi:hypothetical protein
MQDNALGPSSSKGYAEMGIEVVNRPLYAADLDKLSIFETAERMGCSNFTPSL